jgi:hypothetical protein
MSMTSKVNAKFQRAIVNFITAKGNANTTNEELYFNLFTYRAKGGFLPSLRSIQEATQKLTKAGILASPQRGTYRLASLATAATV